LRAKRSISKRSALLTLALILAPACVAGAELLENVRFLNPQPPEAGLPEVDRLRFDPPRAEQPPTLDGRLDEAVWEEPGAYLGRFRLGLSATPARHTREAWAAWDDQYLYIGVRLQREPGTELRVLTHEPDVSAIWEDDEIEVFVDPFSTGTEYYHLIINSEGVVYDASMTIVEVADPRGASPGDTKLVRQSDLAWPSGVERAVHIEDRHWTVELALPMASIGLAGAPAGHRMGLNLTSADWDTEEYTCLSPTSNWHDPRQFGVLSLGEPRLGVPELDLSGVGPGRNLLRLAAEHLRGPTGSYRLVLVFDAPGQRLEKQVSFALEGGDRREVGLIFPCHAEEGRWSAQIDIIGPDGRAVYATRRSGDLPGPMRVALGTSATFGDGPPVRVSARLGVGRLTARGLTLVASLIDGAGHVLARQEIGAVDGPNLSAVMPLDGLAPGVYALSLEAVSGGEVVASGSDALRVASSPFQGGGR